MCDCWSVAAGRTLLLDRPRLMAVLNVTPDSFSDGGRHLALEAAVEHAHRCIEEGADILDIGGESTRPGSVPVQPEVQIERVVPVIERLAGLMTPAGEPVLLSIDTTRSEVARRALDAGAHIVNDISAGRDDPQMLPLVAQRRAGLILMHRLRPPAEDSYSDRYAQGPAYDDVVREVREFLDAQLEAAVAAGVSGESIVLDPGLGFGKTVEQNYELIRRVREIMDLGRPVLSAASRKSFIGRVSGVERPDLRRFGTLSVSLFHFHAGIRLFRVHDVAEHRQALAVAERIG